jgi:ADP-heptose:LPS heptosyltransferase
MRANFPDLMAKKNVLMVRNDKLGDFMLAWPAFALLKSSLPDCDIAALVPQYTRELAECCPWIDRVVVDPEPDPRGLALRRMLGKQVYDAVITLYSTSRVGFAAWWARIPVRIAPATKIAQVFCNHPVKQRRSRSEKPEYVYNLELVEHLLECWGHPPRRSVPPYLRFESSTIIDARARFCAEYRINEAQQLVFVHAGGGGSALNLSISQYATLASKLVSDGHVLVLCAGPGEATQTRQLATSLARCEHVVFESRRGLVNYAKHIAFADVFISGSTGPLHIAGALNRSTAAFYSRRRSANALRWQTLNDESRRLAFSPPPQAHEDDMNAIDLNQAANAISKHLLAKPFPIRSSKGS